MNMIKKLRDIDDAENKYDDIKNHVKCICFDNQNSKTNKFIERNIIS